VVSVSTNRVLYMRNDGINDAWLLCGCRARQGIFCSKNRDMGRGRLTGSRFGYVETLDRPGYRAMEPHGMPSYSCFPARFDTR
jgi:hypothetical protein